MRAIALPVSILLCAAVVGAAESETGAAPASDRHHGFDVSGALVPEASIISGGPGRDGIKSVDAPRFASAALATWVAPGTPVLGLTLGEGARAYPVHLMEYHQVVNDVIGGNPVVVTYDPLTAAPRAYRARVGERALSFGVSGLLYNSGFLLYDRETESLWSQFDGRALAGPLAGRTLERLPLHQIARDPWLAVQPDSVFLARPALKQIDYRHSPYERYWISDEIVFPVNARDDAHHAKEVVVGVVVNGKKRAYLGSYVTAAGGKVVDEFEDARIEVVYDTNHAYFVFDAADGVDASESYWFAWKAFHPETDVWMPPTTEALP